jgi:hypothetical protein
MDDVAIWKLGMMLATQGLALGTVVAFCKQGQAQRRLRATPTSKAKGVFMGPVEVKGRIVAPNLIQSFLAEIGCVFYHYSVTERRTRTTVTTETDSEGNTRTVTRTETDWVTVASQEFGIPFLLQDETGSVQIDPVGATVEGSKSFSETVTPMSPLYFGKGPSTEVMGSDHIRTFTEYVLTPDLQVFIVGTARERKDAVAPEIALGRKEDRFLISIRSEEQIIRGHGWSRVGLLLATFVFSLGIPLIALLGGKMDIEPELVFGCPIALVAIIIISEVIALGNIIKEIVQRTRNAYSLVDIQLKRRADLIPQLVSAVNGMKDHEATTLSLVADLRAGKITPGVLIEQLPQLSSQPNFLKLQSEIADTETRIALARSYYAESYHLAHSMLDQFPGILLKRSAGLDKLVDPRRI